MTVLGDDRRPERGGAARARWNEQLNVEPAGLLDGERLQRPSPTTRSRRGTDCILPYERLETGQRRRRNGVCKKLPEEMTLMLCAWTPANSILKNTLYQKKK